MPALSWHEVPKIDLRAPGTDIAHRNAAAILS